MKIRFTYSDYKGFPGAASFSRKFNLLRAAAGIIIIFVSLFTISFNLYFGISIFILSVLLAVFSPVLFHDRPLIETFFKEIKDLSPQARTYLVNHFMDGKIIGTGDVSSAYSVALKLLSTENKLRSGEISQAVFREYRQALLSSMGFNDSDYSPSPKQEEYCFENVSEYNLCKRYVSPDVFWNQNDSGYHDLLGKASQMLAIKDYSSAVSFCKDALLKNPIALRARFILVNCFLQQNDPYSAEFELKTLGEYLYADDSTSYDMIARYYRLLGQTEVSLENDELAYSCYKNSLLFCDNNSHKTMVFDRMNRIISANQDTDFSHLDFKEIIRQSQFPFFVAYF